MITRRLSPGETPCFSANNSISSVSSSRSARGMRPASSWMPFMGGGPSSGIESTRASAGSSSEGSGTRALPDTRVYTRATPGSASNLSASDCGARSSSENTSPKRCAL